ncbi:MAG: Uma2 family endonuclease [Spirulinaceae cyanobacterium RM2_2_10]|nr:Uma2 family endonuclease [Spirulinaceae cyanobacterium SM2_1_0]NJO20950.1 Uma2 family endonuclease [Spirulinaceae cyanobacterium RM2_2_10]
MTSAPTQSLTLREFLTWPEIKPAREYCAGIVTQKIMPKARHSRLQIKLAAAINQVAEAEQIAFAFPELRCTFGDRSIVPDIAVLCWSNLEFDAAGEPLDDVLRPPDWLIEILSPGQSANPVTDQIVYSLQHGSELGWLVEPSDRSLLIFRPQQLPQLARGDTVLPVLSNLALQLTPNTLFDWLQMRSAEAP